MSGKPAARQGDMTQYGGSIVQGSAGVRIGAPTGVACSVCPGGVTSGHPVNPLLGAKVLPGETDIALPGRCRSSSPAPTAVTGQKRPRRWGASAPAGKCLRISAYSCAITH
ncbi:rhsA element core protein RshA [Escherichia coli]|nr:rhsA element core protein RshA [Escherichia coli]